MGCPPWRYWPREGDRSLSLLCGELPLSKILKNVGYLETTEICAWFLASAHPKEFVLRMPYGSAS